MIRRLSKKNFQNGLFYFIKEKILVPSYNMILIAILNNKQRDGVNF